MAQQASIVRSTAGRENDEMVTYLWSEMLDVGADCEKVDHTSRHFRVTPEMIAREAVALDNRADQILALF